MPTRPLPLLMLIFLPAVAVAQPVVEVPKYWMSGEADSNRSLKSAEDPDRVESAETHLPSPALLRVLRVSA